LDTEFKTGDRVRLAALPPYFKTAEPMPMLRPPNVVQIEEEGVILGREPGDAWRVRFSRGAYLIDRKYLRAISEHPVSTLETSHLSVEMPDA
jgi:Protein of unknown function (DUF3148)